MSFFAVRGIRAVPIDLSDSVSVRGNHTGVSEPTGSASSYWQSVRKLTMCQEKKIGLRSMSDYGAQKG